MCAEFLDKNYDRVSEPHNFLTVLACDADCISLDLLKICTKMCFILSSSFLVNIASYLTQRIM